MELADLDGDGTLDAFVANRKDNGAAGAPNTVWYNDGTGKFGNPIELGSGNSKAVALADLNGDSYIDAFVANDGPDIVWKSNGVQFDDTSGVETGLDGDSHDVALADLVGDSELDAIVATEFGAFLYANRDDLFVEVKQLTFSGWGGGGDRRSGR